MQQPGYLEVLKERYKFDEWKDAGRAAKGRVSPVNFTGEELPGWRLVRQTRKAPAGHPPMVRSMWQGASGDHLLGVDVFECASPAAAREYLLHRLGEVQGPTLARDVTLGVGDVAFATPGLTMVAFARGPLVVVVHNAGRRVESLGSVAAALDARLRAPDKKSS
jgi:hypothetical protein